MLTSRLYALPARQEGNCRKTMKFFIIALFALGIAIPAYAVTFQGGERVEDCQTDAERVTDWQEACNTDKDVSSEVIADCFVGGS